MKIKVKEDKCIGCGACEALAEDYFKVNSVSKVKKSEVKKEDEEKVKDAAESCPTHAIELSE
ncbi:ferredoxin [Candidatus Woesearchaeota archaeon]|nr:ferredoxin [Candidatus Woesearchaeota archaeon]